MQLAQILRLASRHSPSMRFQKNNVVVLNLNSPQLGAKSSLDIPVDIENTELVLNEKRNLLILGFPSIEMKLRFIKRLPKLLWLNDSLVWEFSDDDLLVWMSDINP